MKRSFNVRYACSFENSMKLPCGSKPHEHYTGAMIGACVPIKGLLASTNIYYYNTAVLEKIFFKLHIIKIVTHKTLRSNNEALSCWRACTPLRQPTRPRPTPDPKPGHTAPGLTAVASASQSMRPLSAVRGSSR